MSPYELVFIIVKLVAPLLILKLLIQRPRQRGPFVVKKQPHKPLFLLVIDHGMWRSIVKHISKERLRDGGREKEEEFEPHTHKGQLFPFYPSKMFGLHFSKAFVQTRTSPTKVSVCFLPSSTPTLSSNRPVRWPGMSPGPFILSGLCQICHWPTVLHNPWDLSPYTMMEVGWWSFWMVDVHYVTKELQWPPWNYLAKGGNL